MKIVKIKLSQIKGSVFQPRSQDDLEIQMLGKNSGELGSDLDNGQ